MKLFLLSLVCFCSLGVAHADQLDPVPGRHFVLSVMFELSGIPKPPGRVPIVSKLMNFGRGANGYGLSLRAFETSIRPQVYWSRADGKGGFFTFGDYPFRPRERYTITIVAKPEEFLALYIEPRTSDGETPYGKPLGKVKFLGGHELSGIASPTNESPLNYKTPGDYGDSESRDNAALHNAKVIGVFVATPETLPESREKLGKFLRGAPESLSEELEKGDIKLWEVSPP